MVVHKLNIRAFQQCISNNKQTNNYWLW